MIFTPAPESMKLGLYYGRLGEFMTNAREEPVDEHTQPESKVVEVTDGCLGTLHSDSGPWYANATTSQSGLTTINTLGLPELAETSQNAGRASETHPKQSWDVNEQTNGVFRVQKAKEKGKKNPSSRLTMFTTASPDVYYLQGSSSMSTASNQSMPLNVVDHILAPLTQTVPHEVQQSPGQHHCALWGIQAGAATASDPSVARVLDAGMKPPLLDHNDPSDDFGESMPYQSTASGADSTSTFNGPQARFVGGPGQAVNGDVAPRSYITLPFGYIQEFDEFTCNRNTRTKGGGYDNGSNTSVQVTQLDDRETSLWSPPGPDSTVAPVVLSNVTTLSAAAVPPTTLEDARSLEPTEFYGSGASQPFYPICSSPFNLATNVYGMPSQFP
ncbi:hypothetical protein FALBO_5247 [Fusarium albosuccineum]|uniref:Uncharacterized protein n=1 Tax=Fusarium albosuccineum TaxID=1237068 RepID=A0A8H4LGZ3_9HYPO|nr:hypothetical protein FALBO_5247 [Fusarium albosuccineum]